MFGGLVQSAHLHWAIYGPAAVIPAMIAIKGEPVVMNYHPLAVMRCKLVQVQQLTEKISNHSSIVPTIEQPWSFMAHADGAPLV